MINKKQVCRHFGKMSKSYDNYAVVQKEMASSLQLLARETGTFHRILEIGCGTGFFTKLLAELYPHSHIIATDISPGMLSTAKNNLSAFTNISYQLEDGENLQLSGPFDLIISNAAFQWFHDYHQAFRQFYNYLRPGGYLLYATLGSNTFCELHTSFTAARQSLDIQLPVHHGPAFISMNILADIGQQLGFDSKHYEEFHKEYFPTVKDFLTSVKKIGANNASHSNTMIINRSLMFSMMDYYEQHFKLNGQIYATYHIIYGCEQRPSADC
ncbi:MAG: malonyl-ACP O-methyltransferase BioC [Sporomusaceae bacterium]|nr:malonyl-ACP O-methyltransferase BioC [Sporomusaceae bacterium]